MWYVCSAGLVHLRTKIEAKGSRKLIWLKCNQLQACISRMQQIFGKITHLIATLNS